MQPAAGDAVKLIKLQIKNFRSLKNLEVDLETYLSIIVGKNNSGKTSLLVLLERFLGSASPRFDFDDFNLDFQKHLVELVQNTLQPATPYPFCGLALRVFIEYSDNDDLANVGNKVIMDLDPDNRWIVLDFLYHLSQENLEILRRDYKAHQDKKAEKAKDALQFLRENHSHYFKLARRSVLYDHLTKTVQEDVFVDLIKEAIRIEDIISFKRINALRSVSNKDSDRSLSTMSAKIYSAMSTDAGQEGVFDTFKEALSEADGQLDGIYADLFKDVIADVRKFGGVRDGDTQIQIKSTLQHRELLEGNTTVMYGQGAEIHVLPESYNGLGYLNLISIIFDIKIILNEFRRSKDPKPADINLLFIEEPEAHTHPQMQAIFIRNIKSLIGREIENANGIKRPLQTILSTHSAYIISESDFDDIKYFKKTNGETKSKCLRDLKQLYEDSGVGGHYKFLKQYLTLHRSQLFFADKAILVEGDTERILLPAMMRKIDQIDAATAWEATTVPPLPLMSQNISVIEVGAHSQIFEILLDFIGVKTLIITDIDSAVEEVRTKTDGKPDLNSKGGQKKDLHAHAVKDATHTTNHALQFYFGVGADIKYFLDLAIEDKTVRKNQAPNSWEAHSDGWVMCVYQVPEINVDGEDYHARSFEDAFFHINRKFMKDAFEAGEKGEAASFPSLRAKHLNAFLAGGCSFAMAEDGITKKPSFAIEVLLNSKTIQSEKTNAAGGAKKFVFEFSNWNIPKYIEEGLRWIKKG
jgi:predicted ATP-dependent endonuclease of OLD family